MIQMQNIQGWVDDEYVYILSNRYMNMAEENHGSDSYLYVAHKGCLWNQLNKKKRFFGQRRLYKHTHCFKHI